MSLSPQQSVAFFSEGFEHKHYIGETNKFDVFEELQGHAKGFFIKVFFINTKINLNKWQVTWDGIKQDIKDVVGVPIVLQDDFKHPQFAIQNLYAKGYIVDFVLDEDKQSAYVIARILDPETIQLIQEGKVKFVSPAIGVRSNLDLETLPNGVELLHRFIALHLALVKQPAYGKVDAHINGMCKGTGQACGAKLKQMDAATLIALEATDTCTSKKIEIIKKEKPNISHAQAVAIAISMCEENPKIAADGIPALEQTKLLKLKASINRSYSEFHQIERHASRVEHGGNWGYWIKAKDIDVFVADGMTVDESISSQCPCDLRI